jgi:ADP-heptose:LPS heptosyltransferase
VAVSATGCSNLLWVEGAPARAVAVLRALPGLGDMLCLVPALRALRGALPHAHVAVIGLPAAGLLLERFPGYVDELIPFPGYPGIPEQRCELPQLSSFLQEMRARRFDLALQLHGSGELTNEFVSLLGARATAGFQRSGVTPLDRVRTLRFSEYDPEPLRNLGLLQHLGANGSPELEFTIRQSDRARLELATSPLLDDPFAIIHPGASRADRRWPAERFAEVGDVLAARGLHVMLTGSEDEHELVLEVARRMRAPSIDLAGSTDVGMLAALLDEARLLVCNDTGVSHLAAAVCAPSVVIFATSQTARWAPLDADLHRTVVPADSIEPVLHAIDELLSGVA